MNNFSKILVPFFMGLVMMLAFSQLSLASESLSEKSTSQISSTVSGLAKPDVNVLINQKNKTNSAMQIAQNNSQQSSKVGSDASEVRSIGCTSGCTSGCTAGCTAGCSSGCQ